MSRTINLLTGVICGVVLVAVVGALMRHAWQEAALVCGLGLVGLVALRMMGSRMLRRAAERDTAPRR